MMCRLCGHPQGMGVLLVSTSPGRFGEFQPRACPTCTTPRYPRRHLRLITTQEDQK